MDKSFHAAADLIYLISCAVNKTESDADRVRKIDLDALYSFAQTHSLLCLCAYALADAGIKDERFTQAQAKAIRRSALFDIERKKIMEALDHAGIWYMPLKGSILQAYYPKFGMREMSDVDILCDPQRISDVKKIMESMGYECHHFGSGTDDAYFKPPMLNFEMHHCLFDDLEYKVFGAYYRDVKLRLIRDNDTSLCYRFRDEDLYLYILAHMFKHYVYAGTGLRALLDVYLIVKRENTSLDFDYIGSEAEKLGIAEFEQTCRVFANRIFSSGELSEELADEFSYMLRSGAYGTAESREYNYLYRRLNGKGGFSAKMKYFFSRIFINKFDLRFCYPFFYHHRYLLPALYVYRVFRGLFQIKRLFAEAERVVRFQPREDAGAASALKKIK